MYPQRNCAKPYHKTPKKNKKYSLKSNRVVDYQSVSSSLPKFIRMMYMKLRPRMINQALLNSLSIRERQLLLQIANGSQNQDIAFALCISSNTVKNHKEKLKRKLGLGSTTELYMASSGIKTWLEENGGANLLIISELLFTTMLYSQNGVQ